MIFLLLAGLVVCGSVAFAEPERSIVLTKLGAMPITQDSVGLSKPEDIGLESSLHTWDNVLYSDYVHLISHVTSACDSTVIADMAVKFLCMKAQPPLQQGKGAYKKHNLATMFGERIVKLISLGHLELAEQMWEQGVEENIVNPNIHKARLFVYVYCNKMKEAKKCIDEALEYCSEEEIQKQGGFWGPAQRILKFLTVSNKEAEGMALAQKDLMGDGGYSAEMLREAHIVILEKRYNHIRVLTPLLVKLILKFIPIDRYFVEKLPKHFYPMVYYDDTWKGLDDHTRLIILEHLVKNGAVSASALLNFYAFCDASDAIPYDRRMHEKICFTNDDALVRAALYKEIRHANTQKRGELLAQFMQKMAREGLLLAVVPELKRYVQDSEPSERLRHCSPLYLFAMLMTEEEYAKEDVKKWLDFALTQETDIPAIPAYLILHQNDSDRKALKDVFVQWYRTQPKGPYVQKVLWVLSQAIPWLAEEVSIPHFQDNTGSVTLETSVTWALAAKKDVVLLGMAVQKGVSTTSALLPALKLRKEWGHKLAIECMLK